MLFRSSRIFSHPQIGHWAWPFLTQLVHMRSDIGPGLFQRSLNTGYNWSPQSALMRIEESPSRITLFTPISAANSRALIEASVSTSNTVAGKCICCESEANTSPALLRMTTPIPARFSLIKSAPSIFFFLHNHDLEVSNKKPM